MHNGDGEAPILVVSLNLSIKSDWLIVMLFQDQQMWIQEHVALGEIRFCNLVLKTQILFHNMVSYAKILCAIIRVEW